MKAVILSAGQGKRFGSITEKIPKGLVKINQKPLLEYILDDLIKLNFNEICIVIGYRGEQIIEYFGNGESFGIKITYVTQTKQLGTADALKQAQTFVGNNPFLLHLGDAINPNALKDNIQKMVDNENDVSLLVCSTKNVKRKLVGNIEMNNNIIKKIAEKSLISNSNYFWAGVAYFKNNLIFEKFEKLILSHTGEYEITDAVNDLLIDGIIVNGITCSLSIDVGTESGLIEASKYL